MVDGQIGKPHDNGEDVVEVVRDAAGEAPDGLHPLRLPELRLEFVARRDVAGDALRTDDRRFGANRMDIELEGQALAEPAHDVELESGDALAIEHLPQVAQRHLGVLGDHEMRQVDAARCRSGEAGDVPSRTVHGKTVTLAVHCEDDVVGVFDQLSVLLFGRT